MQGCRGAPIGSPARNKRLGEFSLMPPKNSYAVLNLRKGATEEQVKQAYIELVKKLSLIHI